MKLSVLALCLASVAVADTKVKVNGYCVEHVSQQLSGTFAEGDCRTESKKCSVKQAIKRCEKLANCTGVTCYDKNKKKCVVHSSTEFSPAGPKVSTWMRSDNLCAETRVPGKGKGGKDEFEMDDMLKLQMMNGGRPIDPNTAMLFGAEMNDLVMMNMMGSVTGDVDPTVMMLTGGDVKDVMVVDMMAGGDGSVAAGIDPAVMMLAGGDMKDVMMLNAMSGGQRNPSTVNMEPIDTVNGVRCASGATRIVETSEGPKRVCAPAVPATTTLTSGTSGVRCMYGTRVVTTADGNTVTVCATRPVSSTTTVTTTGEMRAMGSDDHMVGGTSEKLGLKGKLRRRRRIAAKKRAEAAAAVEAAAAAAAAAEDTIDNQSL